MPKQNNPPTSPENIRQTFSPLSTTSYPIYIGHRSFNELTVLCDWRAKAYRIAELLALPIKIRTQADCTLEVSLLERAGMAKIEHGMKIKLYDQPLSTKPATNPNQFVPEGFDYAELRIAINRIVRQMDN